MEITRSASITSFCMVINCLQVVVSYGLVFSLHLILDAGLSPLNYRVVFKNLNICSFEFLFVLTMSPAVSRSGDIQSHKFINSN